jgi:hypothetical protein
MVDVVWAQPVHEFSVPQLILAFRWVLQQVFSGFSLEILMVWRFLGEPWP